jgi:hypothetical protein
MEKIKEFTESYLDDDVAVFLIMLTYSLMELEESTDDVFIKRIIKEIDKELIKIENHCFKQYSNYIESMDSNRDWVYNLLKKI